MQAPQRVADARGDGGARQTPAADEDEDVVEYNVEPRGQQVAAHHEIGGSVEPHGEHQNVEEGDGHEERYEPQEVFACGSEQRGRRAQQSEHGLPCGHEHDGGEREARGRYGERLRNVDARHAGFAAREVYRCHDRAAHAEHEPETRGEGVDRCNEIDGRQSVAAHAASDKDAVRYDEDRRTDHPQHRGQEKAQEEAADCGVSEIDAVAFHRILTFFSRGKGSASAAEKSYLMVISASRRRGCG